MLKDLSITGFRSFEAFTFSALAPVNLIVGRNNSGKTSLLEAVSLLDSGFVTRSLLDILGRRGEFLRTYGDDERGRLSRYPDVGVDPTHLFRGRQVAAGSRFQVAANGGTRLVEASIDPVSVDGDHSPSPRQRRLLESDQILALRVAHRGVAANGGELVETIPLSAEGLIDEEYRRRLVRADRPGRGGEFLGTQVDLSALARMWTVVARARLERQVVEVLKIVASDIQDVTFLGEDRPLRTSFLVGVDGLDQRVPLASMGEGVWRLLSLILAGISARENMLLVDEIDTGLHHSALEKMWEVVADLATRGTQTFATTHSSDCVRALAKLCEKSVEVAKSVAVHRVEAGAAAAVTFNGPELVRAVTMDMELRGW